jgi:hypothetical protein
MTKTSLNDNWKQLDQRVRREDEDRWLSSRYAGAQDRRQLIALYALNLELAKVRLVVSEPGLAAIRFQWWRDVAAEMQAGKRARGHDVVQALYETELSPKLVTGLADGHEAALEANDRNLEPEVLLMRAAAGMLVTAHSWGGHIKELAPAYAAARRGDGHEYEPAVPIVPSAIRPAIAHAALRFEYGRDALPGPIRKRIVVMTAMARGRV